jgi:tetraacyldisaccharide 4'-kinase
LSELNEAYIRLDVERKIIVTTEKDAARLVNNDANIPETLRQAIYSLPIEVAFHNENSFKQIIKEHVRTIKRNRVVD